MRAFLSIRACPFCNVADTKRTPTQIRNDLAILGAIGEREKGSYQGAPSGAPENRQPNNSGFR
jgi:hypothetical protein